MAVREADVTIPLPQAAERGRRPFRRWFRDLGWRHLVGLLGIFFSIYPLVWIVSASFNSIDNLTVSRLIPESLTFENYRSLFDDPTLPFPRWLWNSVKIAFVVSSLQLVMSTMAAYSFSRLRWKGRRAGLLFILLIQVFPQFLAFVAIFLFLGQLEDLFGGGVTAPWSIVGPVVGIASMLVAAVSLRRDLGHWGRGMAFAGLAFGAFMLFMGFTTGGDATVIPGVGLNTHAGIILVYLGGAVGVNTWLIKGFMDSLPFSLDESALVDGASQWQIFSQVIVPLARPVLAVIFVITFVFIYNEFILASLLLRDIHETTYPVGLSLFSDSQYSSKWGALTAAAVMGGAPIVAVMVAGQKQLIGGLTTGAVKG